MEKYYFNTIDNGSVCIDYCNVLNDETKIWTFDLLKRNMQSM